MGAPCGKDERPPYHPGLAAQPAPGFYYHGGPPLGPYDAVPGHVVPGHVVPGHGVSPPVSAPSHHGGAYSHPYTDSGPVTRSSASSAPPRRSTTSCHRGVECTDFSEEHRRRFSHPENILLACQYGSKCYQKNLAHLKHFVHPGDRHYRMGLVHFPTRKGVRVQKEFPTLRDLFNFCDPDESGNISKEEFQGAWDLLVDLPPEVFGMEGTSLKGSPEQAWETAAGDERSHLTFAQFAKWAAADMKIQLPVGVDPSDTAADRPCRFQYKDRCPCVNFKATAANPTMCECGHKSSAHLSDVALMTQEEQEVLNKLKRRALGRGASKTSLFAPARKPGVTFVTDPEVLAALQELLSQTHKDHDNWTRDRGCALHGRHRCEASCLFRHRAPVPTGYKLIRAERNRNPALYHTYATTRGAIKQETVIGSLPFATVSPKSACDIPHEESLDPQVNEWRLLHGTSLQACKGICASNFRLKMAGSGATWKEPGMGTGRPLYGYGVYCAESSTKADEYAEEIRGGLPSDEGCHAMLVCRVVGGLCRIVDTNEFDPDDLRQDVLDGPYHSVLGDRVVKLKKPFREIVVHDNNQIFPEFILYYKRLGIPE